MLDDKRVFAHFARVPLESVLELFQRLLFRVCVPLRKHCAAKEEHSARRHWLLSVAAADLIIK